MLHLRRIGRTGGGIGPASAAIWDRLVASDPGLLRLTMAARGTLAVFLMTLAAIAASRLFGGSPVDLAAGVTLSLMGPFLMREPSWRPRLRTLLGLSVAAAAATVATAVLHGQGRVGDTFFLVLVFLGFLLQARSPRAMGLGLVAVVISYVGLFLELPVATLPTQLLSLALSLVVTAFACFVLVPLRPAATLRRTVRALQGRAALVLRDAGGLAAGSPATVRRLRRSLARLNEAALAADDLLALMNPAGGTALRVHLMDLELAVARLAAAPLGAVSGHASRRQAARLAVHERRLRRNRWSPKRALSLGVIPRSAVATALADIAGAAAALGRDSASVPGLLAPASAAPPPGPLAWRLALRVTLASGLAMAGGMALSPQRWFWAVITTYVVFLNTRSRGDTIYKGVQRLGGTVLGLAAGLTLAVVLSGQPAAQTGVLLAALFGMYYLFLVSYTLGIFCVTILLGLLYSLLGASMGPLLVLRLEETAIGAAAAMLVAVFVLPMRTRDQVQQSGTAVLSALAAAVGACRGVLAGEPGVPPVQAIRAVDRQVADLRLALLPLSVGRLVLQRSDAERPVPALLDSVHWARTLAMAATGPDPDAAARAAAIERRLVGLAAGERAAPGSAHAVSATGAPLDRLDRATATLAERLAIGTLHGFRLE